MGSTAASTGYYPITGIQKGFSPGEPVPARMDIDEWWNSNDPVHVDQVSLFIAALKAFQAIEHSDKLSYVRIAGIHKEPRFRWDEGADLKPNTKGYCEHATNLFPTWHRPYLLLFEQRLYEIMVESIIPKFPVNRQSYLKYAAQQWRLPFWDWASKKPVYDTDPVRYDYDVPQLVRLESVRIRGPTGWKWVKNPLYVFRMPGDVPMSEAGVSHVEVRNGNKSIFIDFQACKATSRYPPNNSAGLPNSSNFLDGYQDNDSIMRQLRDFKIGSNKDDSKTALTEAVGGNLTSSLREAFYRIVGMENYEMFSNSHRLDGSTPPAWGSIESLHNVIHGWCGGGAFGQHTIGHMAVVEVAAFDPIFWLHHCNIDRLFAIWQAIHPREKDPRNWFENKADGQKDLKPFRKNNAGTYWKSDDLYDTADLGYTYPHLPVKCGSQEDTSGGLSEQQLQALKGVINTLYGSTRRCEQKAANTEVRRSPLTLKDALKPASLAKIKDQIPSIGADGPEIKDQLDVNDYLVNIKYERFALDGHPFTVHILIGQAPEQEAPVDAIEYKNLVGEVYNFVAPIDAKNNPSGGCANCKTQAKEKLESTGQIVLTNALMTRYKQQLLHENRHEGNRNDVLASMEPPDVIEFLKRNLHWRITDLSGRFVLKEHITSLKVAIVGGKADHYADPTKLSVYRDYKVLYDITAGREGGAGPEHNLFANDITY